MNVKLTDKLVEEFPITFGPTKWATLLRGFGFECGEGWYELIREFGIAAEKHNLANPDEIIRPIIIKEKLAGLRIQGGTGEQYLRDLIRNLEDRSYDICETCGSEGTLYYANWYKFTRCAEHAVTWRGDKMKLPKDVNQ